MCPDAAVKLGIITFINHVTSTDSIVAKYNDLFEGIGKMRSIKVKLNTTDNVAPVAPRLFQIAYSGN